MPGVQKPHWTAASSIKACWMGFQLPVFRPAGPTTVEDGFALGPGGKIDQEVWPSIDETRCSAALAYLAAFFDACEPQAVSQGIGQGFPGVVSRLHGPAVHGAVEDF